MQQHTDLSFEATLHREIVALREWLTDQGLDTRDEDDHADESSRDRLYWRYGYYVGLKRALELLTSQGATLH